jgi:hypothetical protein
MLQNMRPEVDFQQWKILIISVVSTEVLGPNQPPKQWVTEDLYPGVKRQESENKGGAGKKGDETV